MVIRNCQEDSVAKKDKKLEKGKKGKARVEKKAARKAGKAVSKKVAKKAGVKSAKKAVAEAAVKAAAAKAAQKPGKKKGKKAGKAGKAVLAQAELLAAPVAEAAAEEPVAPVAEAPAEQAAPEAAAAAGEAAATKTLPPIEKGEPWKTVSVKMPVSRLAAIDAAAKAYGDAGVTRSEYIRLALDEFLVK